jgi:MATE family multidrug resistance protein
MAGSIATPPDDRSPPPATLGAEVRRLLALAVPLALVQMGQHLMTVVDTAMLGRFSSAAMAGAGIGGAAFFGIGVLGLGILLGLDALVPQALGAGDSARAGTFHRAGVRLAVLVSIPLTLALIGIALLFPHIGLRDPEVAAAAREYLLWRIPGLFPYLVVVVHRSTLQAYGRTRPLVLFVVLANLLNLAGDYVLVFGDPGLERIGLPAVGLPALGAAGAAIATGVVATVGAAMLGLAARSARGEAPPPDPADVRRIFRLGLPVGLHLVAEFGIFGLAFYVAGLLPGHAAAGHQVAISLASLSFAMAVGVGGAAAVRVGHAVGAGDRQAARRAGTAALVAGMVMMGSAGLVFAVFPAALAALFTHDAAVIAAAVPLVQIAAVFQLSDSLQAVGAGALRGAGETRSTFIGNVVGHYALGLPVAVVLALPLGLGAPGLWWGLTAGLTAVALFLVLRFYRVTGRAITRAI